MGSSSKTLRCRACDVPAASGQEKCRKDGHRHDCVDLRWPPCEGSHHQCEVDDRDNHPRPDAAEEPHVDALTIGGRTQGIFGDFENRWPRGVSVR